MDKNIFFIFGTVRTRSTWFSNLFTYKDSFCYNEESRYMISLDELYERIERRPEPNVGFCDPELYHYVDKVYEMFPTAKYLLLTRNTEDTIDSHVNITGGHQSKEEVIPKFKLWAQNEEYMKNNIKYMSLDFNYMDSESIEYVWDYILPDCDWDVGRFELLDAMRISTTITNKPQEPIKDCLSPYFNYDHPIFKSVLNS